MTIRPMVLNGTIQRTQDMGVIKQQADEKPVVDQHNIQGAVAKEEKRLSRQVIEPHETEKEEYRYDAKEKGNSSYQQKGNSKKKQQEKQQEAGSVSVKGQSIGIDIKI